MCDFTNLTEVKGPRIHLFHFCCFQSTLTGCPDLVQVHDMISSRISMSSLEFHKSLDNSAHLDPSSFVNTDSFQTIWLRNESLLWCRTNAEGEDAIAARFVMQLTEEGAQRAFYFPCASLLPVAGRPAPLTRVLPQKRPRAEDYQSHLQQARDQDRMYLSFLQIIMCQDIAGWPQNRISIRGLIDMMPLEKLEVLLSSLTEHPDVNLLHKEVFKICSSQLKPVMIIIEFGNASEDAIVQNFLVLG